MVFFISNLKKKKKDDIFLRKKTEEKQNNNSIMICVNGKRTVFPVKLELQGELSE